MRRTWKTKAAILSAAVAAGTMYSTTAHAAQRNWAPGVTGDIGATTSWQGGLVPGSGDQANVSGGTATVVTGDNYTFSEVWAGFQNPGDIEQSGGTITAGWVVVGRGVSGNTTGTWNFSGGTINQNAGGSEVQLVGLTSAGAAATVMTISQNTATPTVLNNAGTFDIGDQAATVNQTGGTVNSAGQLWIGQSGTGIYNLSGGVVNTSNWAVIGRGGGTGTLNLTGGTFIHSATSSGDFEVGSGGNATLNLTSGLLITNYFRDENGGSQTAVINFNGATVQANNSDAGFIGGHMSNNDVYTMNVLDGGAIFNTSSFNIGISASQPLVHGAATIGTLDGGLTKYGSGSLTLNASNTYTGPTTINQGTLNLLGSLKSNIIINNGVTFGSYSATGTGGSTTGSLTFNGTDTFQVNPNNTQFLNVSGGVVATGASVSVVPTITTAASGVPIEVLHAGGGITGTFGALGSGSNFTPTGRGVLTESTDATTLYLTAAPANLVWKGTSGNPSFWDTQTTANFYNTGTSAADVFYASDNVTFDDTGTTTGVSIRGTSVSPGVVTFNNSALTYTFTGGAIAGGAILNVVGGGTVNLAQTNTYTGATNISNGSTLAVATGGSLSSNSAINLGSGTTNGILKIGDATGAVNTTGSSLNLTGSGTGNQVIDGNAAPSTLTVTNPTYVGTTGNPTAVLSLGAGINLNANSGSNPSVGVGPGPGTTGTLNVPTGATLTANSNDIWVGNGSGGVGTLNITGGTVLSNGWIAPGRAGGTGTINMTGGTLTKTGSGDLDIAGDGAGSHGYFYQTGGTVTTSTFVVIGENNSSEVGVWNLSGGTTTATVPQVLVGSSGNGTLNIFGGGTLTATGGGTVVGQNGGSVGLLNVSGGTLTTNGLTPSFSATVIVGPGGTINVTGPNTPIASGGGTNATFTVAAGGTFNAGTGQVFVGDNTGVANFNVSGTVNVSNYLAVGRTNGTGTIYLNPGGTINALENDIYTAPVTGYNSAATGNGETILGSDQAGGTGYFYQTGGNFNSANAVFILGEAGSSGSTPATTGVWNLSGGTASIAPSNLTPINFLTSLAIGLGGNGTINVSGTGQLTTAQTTIGQNTGAIGNLNISSATSSVTATQVIVGQQGTGNVNLTAGQFTSTSVVLAADSGSTGTVNVNGGTLSTQGIAYGNGTASLTLNGGTLQAVNNNSNFLSATEGAPLALGSSLTVDTQANKIGIQQSLSGTASLIKQGSGTLTLAASNSYTGNTMINAGTLVVGNANALSTGTAVLANGATLALGAQSTTLQSFANAYKTNQSNVFQPQNSGNDNAVTMTVPQNSVSNSTFLSDSQIVTVDDTKGFIANFTYNHASQGPEQTGADGIAFILQNGSPTAAGGAGGSLGYNASGYSSSIAAAIDLFLDRVDLGMGNGSSGALTNVPAENSSPLISQTTSSNVAVVYTPGAAGANGTLSITMTNSSGGVIATNSSSIDAAVELGGSAGGTAQAYVGFTGATGGANDLQSISDFSFNQYGTSLAYTAVNVSNAVMVADGAVSTLQLAPTANYSSGAVGAIQVGNNSTLAISIGANAATGVTHGVLTATSIAFTNSSAGTLDVAKNALDLTGESLATARSAVISGFAAGKWNGPGISSSAAATDTSHLTTLGVILNSVDQTTTGAALYGTGTALGLFEGISPANTDVLVKYTYYGDANLDGHVDSTDYSRIDNGFINHLTGWYNGDFNYDGVVNGSDYTLIDNAYNTQGASLAAEVATPTAQIAGSSAVPEPTTLGLLGIGAAGLLGRRRRRPQ